MRPNGQAEFWAKVHKTETCWFWTGGQTSHGYGSFPLNGGSVPAHRYAYELANGAIPPGKQLDHLCRNRACVRPDHLEAVSQRVNLLRGETIVAAQARQRHCKRGHEFNAVNTRISRLGWRHCRICDRSREQRGRS